MQSGLPDGSNLAKGLLVTFSMFALGKSPIMSLIELVIFVIIVRFESLRSGP